MNCQFLFHVFWITFNSDKNFHSALKYWIKVENCHSLDANIELPSCHSGKKYSGYTLSQLSCFLSWLDSDLFFAIWSISGINVSGFVLWITCSNSSYFERSTSMRSVGSNIYQKNFVGFLFGDATKVASFDL